jgi:hypothetical protein
MDKRKVFRMSNEIFKHKKSCFINYTIVNALQELTYDWCNNDYYDKYPTLKSWTKDCDNKEVPDIETIHNFLKQFLPKGLKQR